MIYQQLITEAFLDSFKTAFLRKHYNTRTLAEDAVSHAIEKFLPKACAGKFDDELRAYSYLWICAERKLRRDKSHSIFFSKLNTLSSDPICEENLVFEEYDFIDKALSTITDKNKVVIELFLQGMNISEIAEKLNEKTDTIKHRINRTANKIKGYKNF